MVKGPSRRAVLGSLAVSAFTPASLLAGAPAESLRPMVRPSSLFKTSQPAPAQVIANAGLDGAVTFAAADVATGTLIEDHNPRLTLPPASVAKAMTAAYALQALGPGHHFATQVLATGRISNGVVQGDLVLAGGGDPTLDTDGLAALAKDLRAAGVNAVQGDFLVWGGALPFQPRIDPGQPDHVGYDPAVSGLNLNYNRVHFEWRRGGDGYAVSMQARSSTHRPDVSVARMGVVSRAAPVYTYESAQGRDVWTVARGALGNGGSRWLPMRKPEVYAGEVFQTFARAEGISLKAPKKTTRLPRGNVVVERTSAPLRILVRDMLKYSTNLTAETIGLSASIARGARVVSLRDSARAMNRWAKSEFGLRDPSFHDHSGLGDGSRISASDMMRALLELRRRSGLKTLLKSFPMKDARGRPMRDHPISVHAKTGTLNFVSGLGGYADLPNGKEVAFAIFCADIDRRAGLSRAERERPSGASAWNRRAKGLQQDLIERWGVLASA